MIHSPSRPFYYYARVRIGEIGRALAASLPTLPLAQLRAEREQLRAECEGSVGITTAAELLRIYDRELERRQ